MTNQSDTASSDARTYYENAVRANFEFYNTYAEEYSSYTDSQSAADYLQGSLVDFTNANTTEEQIGKILMQKYLRSFLQGGWTPYFEQLRTGSPHFMEPESGSPPKRWMYPQSEYQNNNKNVSEAVRR